MKGNTKRVPMKSMKCGNQTTNQLTGKKSKYITELKEKIGVPEITDEVDKLKIDGIYNSVISRVHAIKADSYVNQYIRAIVEETGSEAIEYEADLITTQDKLARQSADMEFHVGVQKELQTRYMESHDVLEKKDLLEQIDLREDMIQKFQRQLNQTVELRNKIRRAVDQKTWNDKAMKIKEDESMGKNAKNVNDLDFSILETSN